MQSASQYEIFRTVIRKVLDETETLPSLPAITLKIRLAVASQNTTAAQLARLISQDPSLSALLIKYSSSPIYRTTRQPTTLPGIISLLGMSAVSNIVMMHSVKSLFATKTPQLQKLFNKNWKRQISKASMAVFLASRLGYRPIDEVLITSLLTEVGTLAVLSALNTTSDVPSEEDYYQLCRDYSKHLASILLTKWNVDERLLAVVKYTGEWDEPSSGPMQIIDIINLALYHTVIQSALTPNLPALENLYAYHKIPAPLNSLTEDGRQLQIIEHNADFIDAMTRSLQ